MFDNLFTNYHIDYFKSTICSQHRCKHSIQILVIHEGNIISLSKQRKGFYLIKYERPIVF